MVLDTSRYSNISYSNSKDSKNDGFEVKDISATVSPETNVITASSSASNEGPATPQPQLGVVASFLDSFKRKEHDDSTAGDENDLNKAIRSRHLIMISLGTGIGTGLLVGTGSVLSQSGPLGLIIGYIVSSLMVFLIIQAAGELGIVYSNVVGNFTRYPTILVDPAFGFAISFLYTIQWMIVLPLQLVTAAMTIQFWNVGVNLDVFVLASFVVVVLINLGGARGYVEAEFFCNLCKIVMLTGFVILGIIITAGGIPNGPDGYIGGKYWRNPGLFANGFKGVCSVFCYAAFSYGGVETLVLSAAEQKNPLKSIPSATKKVMYRILFIYLLSLIIVCFLVPYTSPDLMGSSGSGSHSSPFVIAIASHGVSVVPHLINAVILISVLSVANSALYVAPRLLLSLAQGGSAPKFLNYIDKRGRPTTCTLVVVLFGMIGFVAASDKREVVFTWLLSISGLGQIFIWISICVSHIRFRDAMRVQGHPLTEIAYKAQTGYWGSYVAIALALFVLVCQFWVAIAPVGAHGKLDATNFFQNYLAFPVVLCAYLGFKVYYKQWQLLIPADKIELDNNRNVYVPEEALEDKPLE
ncbi:amino acid transporter TAT1 KNAG_0J02210 [Huiozyma naganishii CBS 8797]|uniref:Amino acid permease/ SLC12A domain-containing protein n=1 Tax=Huiozyma naganishii (strain ATCC MYA-139 / BCRC 22969 / CBS 8797 / KCTC 17520 / NBRC 10181 / NCYC 3082 / Yp74L-3) TaxID=1071383 RepID=J7S2Y0_HUIN7|nr:hypothetical protein KNAG_0J02210 [Kazachstania naganishii CBS 8797]CCK72302.1 hypothetical protein KNAG_0J02210 [Kazachstania naganishii CBS 8797]